MFLKTVLQMCGLRAWNNTVIMKNSANAQDVSCFRGAGAALLWQREPVEIFMGTIPSAGQRKKTVLLNRKRKNKEAIGWM